MKQNISQTNVYSHLVLAIRKCTIQHQGYKVMKFQQCGSTYTKHEVSVCVWVYYVKWEHTCHFSSETGRSSISRVCCDHCKLTNWKKMSFSMQSNCWCINNRYDNWTVCNNEHIFNNNYQFKGEKLWRHLSSYDYKLVSLHSMNNASNYNDHVLHTQS